MQSPPDYRADDTHFKVGRGGGNEVEKMLPTMVGARRKFFRLETLKQSLSMSKFNYTGRKTMHNTKI